MGFDPLLGQLVGHIVLFVKVSCLGVVVGMFPLILSVLNRDYSTPYYSPY